MGRPDSTGILPLVARMYSVIGIIKSVLSGPAKLRQKTRSL